MAHFLKPIGTKGHEIPEQEGSLDTKRIDFSKEKKPKIGEGNILILFARGSQKLITYVSALSDLQENLENENSPWFIKTKDWAPDYAKRWWTFENTVEKLAAEYLAMDPANKLAPAKRMDAATFATAMYGKTPMELHTDFAYFLINRMKPAGK